MLRRRRKPSDAGGRFPGRAHGFSLIELLIVVAVVGILAAIAVPSYLEHLRRSARSEMQSVLTDLAAREAQFLVDRRAYAGSLATLGYTIPSSVASKYTVAVNVVDGPPPSFTLTATAVGGQAKDTCPTLTITSAGSRTPAKCW